MHRDEKENRSLCLNIIFVGFFFLIFIYLLYFKHPDPNDGHHCDGSYFVKLIIFILVLIKQFDERMKNIHSIGSFMAFS